MSAVRIEERDDRYVIRFDFNRKILDDLKDIIPSEYRPQKSGFGYRKDDDSSWHIQKEAKEYIDQFAAKYVNTSGKTVAFMQFCYLSTFEGELVSELPLPTGWNHIKKEYAATLDWNPTTEKWDRNFIGSRENYSSSRKNASYDYGTSHEKVGTIVEIKDGSYKNIGQSYYRKDEDGWKYLGERSDLDDFETIKEYVTCEDGFENKDTENKKEDTTIDNIASDVRAEILKDKAVKNILANPRWTTDYTLKHLLEETVTSRVSNEVSIGMASGKYPFELGAEILNGRIEEIASNILDDLFIKASGSTSPFNDHYFQTNSQNILGEQTITSGQFGRDKIVVKGTLADAMAKIDVPDVQRFDHFQGNSINDILTESTEVPVDESKKREAKIQKAIARTKAERETRLKRGKATNGLQLLKDTIIAYNTNIEYKDENGKKQYYTISEEEIKVWVTYQTNNGLMDREVIADNAWGNYYVKKPDWNKWHEMGLAYYNGVEWLPEPIYYSGDIYRAIKVLERNVTQVEDKVGREAYEAQLEKLKAIRPKQLVIGGGDKNGLTLTPFDNVWDEIQIKRLSDGLELEEDYSIETIFYNHYLTDLSREELTINKKYASASDILSFWIKKERFPRGTEKQEKQNTKRNTQIVGSHHFQIFLETVLTETDKGIIAELWNRKHNNYRAIPYYKIPVGFNINERFKGGKLAIRPAQREGVAFLSNRGTGIVAYDVGVGKTMTAILSISDGFEKGMFKRPMVVVPQKVYRKWISEIVGEYAVKDIKKGKKVLHKKGDLIAEGILPNVTINDYDNLGVNFIGRATDEDGRGKFVDPYSVTMVTYEGLEQIGFGVGVEDGLTDNLITMLSQGESGRAAAIKSEQAEKWVDKALSGTTINIDDMGIDCIIVDEGHNFRNLFMEVKGDVNSEGEREQRNHFSGGGSTPSTRAIKLFMLNSYIHNEYDNRNTYGLTATPFTNRATEIYSILALYDYQGLKDFGVHNLAQFCKAFIEERYEDVWTAGGTFKSKVTIRSYNNLTTLQEIVFRAINYKTGEEANIVRPEKVVLPLFADEKGVPLDSDYVVETRVTPTDMQMSWLREIALFGGENDAKASKLAPYYPPDDKGNIPGRVLIALNAARTVTFSPYALNLGGDPQYDAKEIDAKKFINGSPKLKYICECIKSVRQYHLANGTPVSGQLIYSDRGTEWFGHIQAYLIEEAGYDAKEIALFHGGVSKGRRERIKESFQRNDIKIIIGSSTMREGVDLQKHCSVIYLAYLDWNPTDLHQLFGRGWRFGNKHSHIRVVVPLVENSSDIFTWQKLSEKMSRINTIWNRSGRTKLFEESELNAEELKKSLINDPKELAKVIIEEEVEGIESQLRIANGELERLQAAKGEIERYTEDGIFLEAMAKEAKENPRSLAYPYGDKERAAFDKRVAALKDYKTDDINGIYRTVRAYANLRNTWNRYQFTGRIDQHRKSAKKLKKIEEQILSRSGLQIGDDFSGLLLELEKKVNLLSEKVAYIRSPENIQQVLDQVIVEKDKERAGRKPVEERVNEFQRLNYLLDCRQGIHTCDIYGRVEEIEPKQAVKVVEVKSTSSNEKSTKKVKATLKQLPSIQWVNSQASVLELSKDNIENIRNYIINAKNHLDYIKDVPEAKTEVVFLRQQKAISQLQAIVGVKPKTIRSYGVLVGQFVYYTTGVVLPIEDDLGKPKKGSRYDNPAFYLKEAMDFLTQNIKLSEKYLRKAEKRLEEKPIIEAIFDSYKIDSSYELKSGDIVEVLNEIDGQLNPITVTYKLMSESEGYWTGKVIRHSKSAFTQNSVGDILELSGSIEDYSKLIEESTNFNEKPTKRAGQVEEEKSQKELLQTKLKGFRAALAFTKGEAKKILEMKIKGFEAALKFV